MSLAGGDLTTLYEAQNYLDAAPSQQVLSGLITRTSRQILTVINRSTIVPHTVTEQFDGTGTRQLVLPSYPIIGSTLNSLTIGGVSIPISPQTSDSSLSSNFNWGYRFHPSRGVPPGQTAVVELVGYVFWPGRQNVVVSYAAGYQVTGEIPLATSWPPLAPYGIWATDQGVTYASTGAALAVTNESPSPGQYVPPSPSASPPVNSYTFAQADIAAGIRLAYGFVPADLEQACLDLIALKAARRRRPGVRSQNLAGQESLSYDSAGIPHDIMSVILPYVSPVPPALGASV